MNACRLSLASLGGLSRRCGSARLLVSDWPKRRPGPLWLQGAPDPLLQRRARCWDRGAVGHGVRRRLGGGKVALSLGSEGHLYFTFTFEVRKTFFPLIHSFSLKDPPPRDSPPTAPAPAPG